MMRARWVVSMLLWGGLASAQSARTSDGEGVPVKRVMPDYPKAAFKDRVEGCVTVSFAILPDGRADTYIVMDSVPQGLFDQATLRALNEWRFKAPTRPGRHAQMFEYRLEGGRPLERNCVSPSYAELNAPGAASAPAEPTKRELQILTKVMPSIDTGGTPGCVAVQFVIHPDGRVGEIGVVDAKPGTRYVAATIAALKQWRFEPFAGPALRGQQTFNFDPELMRLPDDAVRSPFAVATSDGALKSQRCDTGKKP